MIPSTQQLLDFRDSTVVVTGASQGIGAGIARRFAEAGANVAVHYRNGKQEADDTVREISDNNGTAVAIQADLASEEGSKALVDQTLDAFGGLHVLMNNAGIYPHASSCRAYDYDKWWCHCEYRFHICAESRNRSHSLQQCQGSSHNADPISSTGIGTVRHSGQCRISGPDCPAWHRR